MQIYGTQPNNMAKTFSQNMVNLFHISSSNLFQPFDVYRNIPFGHLYANNGKHMI
jgi:hypothetical protein